MPKNYSEDPKRSERKRRDPDSVPQGGSLSLRVMPKLPAPRPPPRQRMRQPHQDAWRSYPINSSTTEKAEVQGIPPPACGESPATRPSENCQSLNRSNAAWPTWRGRFPKDQETSYISPNAKSLPIPSIFLRGFPGRSFAPLACIAAVADSFPIAGPFLLPGKGSSAVERNLLGEVLFFLRHSLVAPRH